MENCISSFLLVLHLILLETCLFAQTSHEFSLKFKTVTVGDKVPDYLLTNLINYPTQSEKLSKFRGKFLMLDFWTSHCAACIEAWPKLINIQNKYKDKLQIILVDAYEDKSIVKLSFEKRKKLANVNVTLPTVCLDTILGNQIFSHIGEPYAVIINEDGVIISIPDPSYINIKNIGDIIDKKINNMPQKVDNTELLAPDFSKPIFTNELVKNILWQSTLAKGADRRIFPTTMIRADTLSGEFFIIGSRVSIRDLYSLAYANKTNWLEKYLEPLPRGRIELNVKDSSIYVDRINGEIREENNYFYQLISEPATVQKLQEIMQSDLKRYFAVESHWEKRKKKCYVLTAQDTAIFNNTNKIGNLIFNDNQIELNNVPFDWLTDMLEYCCNTYYYSPYPIIDETGFKGKVFGISLNANVNDWKALNVAFQKYKMGFTLQEREIDILVITEPTFLHSISNN